MINLNELTFVDFEQQFKHEKYLQWQTNKEIK